MKLKIKYIAKSIWEMTKVGVTAFLLSLLVSCMSFLLLAVPPKYKIWALIGSILAVALYMFFLFITGRSFGDKEFKNKTLNDTRRRVGEIISVENPYERMDKEYKKYKGFIAGFISCVPMIIILFIGLFLDGAVLTGFMAVLKIAYSVYSAPLLIINSTMNMAYMLLFTVIPTISVGFGYLYGGMKLQAQQNMINKELKEIYSYKKEKKDEDIDI